MDFSCNSSRNWKEGDKNFVMVVACFAKLLQLFIFTKCFSRCQALLTNAMIFLMLHKPPIWCI